MAFNLNYLQRLDSTIDLNKISNPIEGQATGQGKTFWTYDASASGTNESEATVSASGYFNGATGYLSIGDWVFVNTNDPGYHIYNVTSATGAATVTVNVTL